GKADLMSNFIAARIRLRNTPPWPTSMQCHSSLRVCWLLLICLGARSQVMGAENWADPRLKLTDGLVLWLDAAVQEAAPGSVGASLSDGSPVHTVYDGSGDSNH